MAYILCYRYTSNPKIQNRPSVHSAMRETKEPWLLQERPGIWGSAIPCESWDLAYQSDKIAENIGQAKRT